jgi:microcystin degradation protein MlrC
MPKRVLFAGLFHETHTFLEGMTSLGQFDAREGAELLRCTGDSSPLGGALEAAQRFGWQIVPVADFRAAPSATVADEVVETFWSAFARRARPELERGLDGIYLVLHGAMVSESFPDVEGEVLRRIRSLPGAADLPVFGVFDLHANVSLAMTRLADGLVAYRENPHTDAREAAQRAAELLEQAFQTGRLPRMALEPAPILWPPTGTGTASDPMRALEAAARRLEAESPDLWAVNVAAGFSFADTHDAGVSFSAVTVGDENEARARLRELRRLAESLKQQGNVTDPPVNEVMARLSPLPPGLTVIVEPADNIGGGAPGDGTGLLRALVEHRVPNAAIAINDPAAVRALAASPIGSRARIALGGKGSRLDAGPLTLEVELVSRSDGRFELEDKQSHLASMAGDAFDMGPCAVARHGGLTILITSRKTPPFDLGQWRSQGIEPAKLSVIGVKAAVAHRRAYDPIAARMWWVDTPGPCTSNLRSLPYRRVRRPVYPLDE